MGSRRFIPIYTQSTSLAISLFRIRGTQQKPWCNIDWWKNLSRFNLANEGKSCTSVLSINPSGYFDITSSQKTEKMEPQFRRVSAREAVQFSATRCPSVINIWAGLLCFAAINFRAIPQNVFVVCVKSNPRFSNAWFEGTTHFLSQFHAEVSYYLYWSRNSVRSIC